MFPRVRPDLVNNIYIIYDISKGSKFKFILDVDTLLMIFLYFNKYQLIKLFMRVFFYKNIFYLCFTHKYLERDSKLKL